MVVCVLVAAWFNFINFSDRICLDGWLLMLLNVICSRFENIDNSSSGCLTGEDTVMYI